MKFKTDFLKNYICETPLALAIERTIECEILSRQSFVKPVMDLGCGEGIFAAMLFKSHLDTGVDLNLKEIDAARKYGVHKELIQCSAENIPKPDGSFNTIFSNSVLEHIPNIDRVLKEAFRLLSSEGHFYVTLPTNFFEQYSFGSLFLTKAGMKKQACSFQNFYNQFWKHFHCYPVYEWQLIFEKAGFEVRQTIQYCPLKVALLNDLLAWAALPAFLTKKLFNRWFIFKKVRIFMSQILVRMIKIDFSVTPHKNGGLVFFDLVKRRQSND